MGITTLIYLAAHAPAEIPEWFEHESPPDRPIIPDLYAMVPEEDREELRAWLFDGSWDLDPKFDRAVEARKQYEQAIVAWNAANNSARYFQWRRFYAEQLARTLAKEGPDGEGASNGQDLNQRSTNEVVAKQNPM